MTAVRVPWKVSELTDASIASPATGDELLYDSSAAQWRNVGSSIFNVKHPVYGAKGDGSTDDTTAISSAITAASNAGGGIVWFPEGTYMVASTLTVPSGVILQGVGSSLALFAGGSWPAGVADSTLKASASMSSLLSWSSVTGGGIRDLTLDLNGNAKVGMLLDGAFNLDNRNVGITNPSSVSSGSLSLTFADNGASSDTITRSGGSFLTDGFYPGAKIAVTGSVSNNGTYTIYSLTATVITLVSANALTNETHTATVSCGGIGVKMQVSGSTAGVGTSWNRFRSFILKVVPVGLFMDGNSGHTANCCHNNFTGFDVGYGDANNATGIIVQDADNNTFVDTYLAAVTGSGYGVWLGPRARANYFFHLQPGSSGMYADTPSVAGKSNLVVGYDQENGQPAPTLNTGAAVTFWTPAAGTGMVLPNNTSFQGIATDGTYTTIFRYNTSNQFEIRSNMSWVDGVNVVLGSTNGTKIGTGASQKLGFFGVSPVVQPTNTGNTAVSAAGSTNNVFRNTTFTGAFGTAAYTIGDLVLALKQLGLISVN